MVILCLNFCGVSTSATLSLDHMMSCDLGNSVSLKKNPTEEVIYVDHVMSCDAIPSGN